MGKKDIRTNTALASLVDRGIRLAERYGVDVGSFYMRNNAVPVDITLRVLYMPEQRRSTGS